MKSLSILLVVLVSTGCAATTQRLQLIEERQARLGERLERIEGGVDELIDRGTEPTPEDLAPIKAELVAAREDSDAAEGEARLARQERESQRAIGEELIDRGMKFAPAAGGVGAVALVFWQAYRAVRRRRTRIRAAGSPKDPNLG